jgi:hypothetical protein
LTVHDIPGRLQWSFKFFENLHMDLSLSESEHLKEAIERYVSYNFTRVCVCDAVGCCFDGIYLDLYF